VERLSLTSIQASQSSLLKFVKKWLNLPTPATVFHPDVLDLPFLPHFKKSAKLSFILAIERSTDPLIIELWQSFLTTDHLGVSDVVSMLCQLPKLLYLISSQLLLRMLHAVTCVPVMWAFRNPSLRHWLLRINFWTLFLWSRNVLCGRGWCVVCQRNNYPSFCMLDAIPFQPQWTLLSGT